MKPSCAVTKLIDAVGETPAVNQIELHPLLTQTALREFHLAHGIAGVSVASKIYANANGVIITKSKVSPIKEGTPSFRRSR